MGTDQLLWEAWKILDAENRAYVYSARLPYGQEAVIPEGPAKGFVIGPEITGERRG